MHFAWEVRPPEENSWKAVSVLTLAAPSARWEKCQASSTEEESPQGACDLTVSLDNGAHRKGNREKQPGKCWGQFQGRRGGHRDQLGNAGDFLGSRSQA
jgi:hypothetical protein